MTLVSGGPHRYFVVEPTRQQLEQIAELLGGGWASPAIDSVFR